MRKGRSPLRPLHACLCLLTALLMLAFARILCGPPPALSENGALKQAQRRHMRTPREPSARWEDRNEQLFAVWDGTDVQVYCALWHHLDRKSIRYAPSGSSPPEPVVRVYDRCILWRDSRSLGWGCPGMPVGGALPLLVKNGDPAVVSGFFTVRGEVDIGERDAPVEVQYRCTADALRSDPHFFTFWIKPGGKPETAQRVLNRLTNLGGTVSGITAEAEIVWYDASGNELYRETFDLIQKEGSEKHGA